MSLRICGSPTFQSLFPQTGQMRGLVHLRWSHAKARNRSCDGSGGIGANLATFLGVPSSRQFVLVYWVEFHVQ